MYYENNTAKDVKLAYIGGGSRGWAWGLMSDLVSCDDISSLCYQVQKLLYFDSFCYNRSRRLLLLGWFRQIVCRSDRHCCKRI